eukprot:c13904_g1_i1 orf=69-1085(+)
MGEHKAVEVVHFNPSDPREPCRLATRRTPIPGPGEVVIRMLCRPVNPSDLLAIQGLYEGWQPTSFPCVPGFEGMGVVHQLGVNVRDLSVGQRVSCVSPKSHETGQGTWQEFVVVPAQLQFPIPDSVDNETGAQFLVNPWTVYAMLHELRVPNGEYVVQTAAGSVFGRMFIQYAHYQGIKTINLVRRNEQKEELKAIGADEVINFKEENVVELVKKITGGKMAFGAIECVGGELTKVVASCLRTSGTILVYGVLGDPDLHIGIHDILFRDVKVQGFWLSRWFGKLAAFEMRKIGAEIMTLLDKKIMQPLAGEKFPLELFKEAILKSQVIGRGGKVFLVS